jgi:hypothetical protein
MGIGEAHIGFWLEDLRKRDNLEDLGMYGRIILKWVFKKWVGEACTEISGSGQAEVTSG